SLIVLTHRPHSSSSSSSSQSLKSLTLSLKSKTSFAKMFSIKYLVFALLAILPVITSAAVARSQYGSYCPGYPVDRETQRRLFNEFISLIQNKQVAQAYNTYVAEDLIEHDPSITDGRQ